MPKMPTKDSLSAPASLRSGRAVITASDVDMSAIGKGMAAAGSDIASAGAHLQAAQEKSQREQDALDLIKADHSQKQALFDGERALDDDGDYATHDERFTPYATQKTDEAAAGIRNPQLREKWRLKADDDILRSREGIIKRADNYVKQNRGVELEKTLDNQSERFTDPDATEDQRQALLKDMDVQIQLGQKAGLVTPQYAQKLRETYLKGSVQREAARRLLNDPEGLRQELLGKNAPLPEKNPSFHDTPDEEGKPADFYDKPKPVKTELIDPATGQPVKAAEGIPTSSGVRQISTKLETGKDDPLDGVANISRDSGNSKSYGNFGLNTGGSIKEFVKDYGDTFGLTAKPGSAEFDAQWKNAAKAAPVEMHEAEMKWWDAHIGSKQLNMLVDAGVDPEVAADPRVQSYFADRSVQYGPASIEKHADRIAEAAGKGGEDPAAFLKAMSQSDASRIETDFPTAIRTVPKGEASRERYIGGLENRVSRREAAALGVTDQPDDPATKDKAGRYGVLSPLERAELLKKTETAMRGRFEAQREQVKQTLNDDVETMRRTGESSPVDLDLAKRVLDPNQVNTYLINRKHAEMEYKATNDLPALPDAELTRRLDAIAPKPGDDLYSLKAKVYEKAQRAISDLREARQNDPAKSVESLPEVKQAATAAASAPDDPAATQNLARVRIEAQKRVGIPEQQWTPITRTEARVIMAPTKGLEGKDLTESMMGVMDNLEKQYGIYAQAAGVSAVQQVVRNKDVADTIQKQLKRAMDGLPASSALTRRLEYLNENGLAEQAFGAFGSSPEPATSQSFGAPTLNEEMPGSAFNEQPSQNFTGKQPPAAAIKMLIGNPGTASDFNRKYGPGAAEIILAQPPENFMHTAK